MWRDHSPPRGVRSRGVLGAGAGARMAADSCACRRATAAQRRSAIRLPSSWRSPNRIGSAARIVAVRRAPTKCVVCSDRTSGSGRGRASSVGRVPQGRARCSRRMERALYVANSWSDTVIRNRHGALEVFADAAGGFRAERGIADRMGRRFLYVANRIGNDVSVIDLAQRRGRQTACWRAAAPATWRRRRMARGMFCTPYLPEPRQVAHAAANRKLPKSIPRGRWSMDALRLHNVARRLSCRDVAPTGGWALPPRCGPRTWCRWRMWSTAGPFGNSLTVFGEDVGGVVQLPLDEMETLLHPALRHRHCAGQIDSLCVGQRHRTESPLSICRKLVAAANCPGRSQSGQRSLGVRELRAGAHSGGTTIRRGWRFRPMAGALYVANRLDDTISVVDTARGKVTGTISLGGPAALTAERRGERLFYSRAFALQGHFGCANCHLDSTFDGLSVGPGAGRFRHGHRG